MIKARPTEYKGVRFRSKSEAIFARYLDLSMVEYERERLRLAGWKHNVFNIGGGYVLYEPKTRFKCFNMDFLFAIRSHEEIGEDERFHNAYIEYKPVRPTDTYIENWVNNVIAIDPEWCNESFMIEYGSPFSEAKRGRIIFDSSKENKIDEGENDWVSIFPELMDYRFDLPNGGG